MLQNDTQRALDELQAIKKTISERKVLQWLMLKELEFLYCHCQTLHLYMDILSCQLANVSTKVFLFGIGKG